MSEVNSKQIQTGVISHKLLGARRRVENRNTPSHHAQHNMDHPVRVSGPWQLNIAT